MKKEYIYFIIFIVCFILGVVLTSQITPGEKNNLQFNDNTFEAHVRFLSDDLLEGRGIATRGGKTARLYIESIFRAAGLKPAFGDSFIQTFDMVKYASDDKAMVNIFKGNKNLQLKYAVDFMGANFGAEESIKQKPIFIGYGINLPERGWDYYRDIDVKGKLLIGFTNEPGQDNPEIFGGKALTLFGRWTYKFEEAARQGAAGLLLIHNDRDAGYSWDVVVNSWSGETFKLADDPYILPIQYWISENTASKIAEMSGYTLSELRNMAESKDFKAMELNIEVGIKAARKAQPTKGANIVGIKEGKGKKDKSIIITAHYDHLGIGREINGDKIYNGAVDNGTALATMLALAQEYGRNEANDITLVFAGVDAEEEGLLGSYYLAKNLPVPYEGTLANINFEMSNAWGETNDIFAVGQDKSELGLLISMLAKENNMTFTPDNVPEQGYFYRSDQFSFAKAGIPSVWLDTGLNYKGKPENYGADLRAEYRAKHYHQPSDEFNSSLNFSGLSQLARLTTQLITLIEKRSSIKWLPEAEFKRSN